MAWLFWAVVINSAWLPLIRAQANTSSVTGSVSYDVQRAPLRRDSLGFSIGPVSITEIVKSTLTAKLLAALQNISGAPVPIRIGGTASDQAIVREDLAEPFLLDPEARDLDILFINKQYFETWSDYFPEDTPFTYTLNFANTINNWGNASLQAQWALEKLGQSLKHFELGDSPDHYAYLAYRNASTWNSTTYTHEFLNAARAIADAEFYRNASSHPAFQAGGFADPPGVGDQQWEHDDLDIINITKAGLTGSGLIDSYSVHLFPEAETPPIRKAQISLDLLSNHNVVYQNLSQYKTGIEAAAGQEAEFVLSAAGTVAGGSSGVSDTFGAALWGVDFILTAASLGVSRTFLHFDGYSPDSPIIPIDYQYRAQNLTAGVRANFYTSLFLAHAVGGAHQLSVGVLPDFNSSELSGFALFDDKSQSGLQKLVLIDLNVYNASASLWNPASQSRLNDTARYTNQSRGLIDITLSTPWAEGTKLKVVRLEGPGTNARAQVRVAGLLADPSSGELVGTLHNETLTVGHDGKVEVQLNHAEAVLVEKLPAQNRTLVTANATRIPASHSEAVETSRKKKQKKSKKNGVTNLSINAFAVLLASCFAILI